MGDCRSVLGIHKPTGVLQMGIALTDWNDAQIESCFDRAGEPQHVLIEQEISKPRVRGVWQWNEDRDEVYFTCPWCGTIGVTDAYRVGSNSPDSVWCEGHRGGCSRHLTLIYREKGKEKDLQYLYMAWKGMTLF